MRVIFESPSGATMAEIVLSVDSDTKICLPTDRKMVRGDVIKRCSEGYW